MKTLILALALLAGTAQAEVIAVLRTQAGGQIRLTNDQSNCPIDSRWFYTATTTGEIMPGCWSIADGDVLAVYRDGSVRLYPMGAFTVRQPPAAPQKQRGQSL